jgi:hypothetical protein
MFRNKFLHGMAIAIVLICMSVSATSLPVANESIDQPPLSQKGDPKLTGVLSDLLDEFEREGPEVAREFAVDRGITTIQDSIRVIMKMESAALAMGLHLTDGIVEKAYRNLAQVLVPFHAMRGLVLVPGVLMIREPLKPLALGVVSEGAAVTGAEGWHNAGYTGQNARVAILDCTGFDGYDLLLGSELPPTEKVVPMSFRMDGDINAGDHGTGCAEIVHDMAPEATLYLVNYGASVVEMGNAVDWLMGKDLSPPQPRVDVISHSVGWLNDGPYDGTGMICDMVNEAHDNGILWINSIGNHANRHWEGPFRDEDGDGWHEFSAGEETIPIAASKGQTIAAFLSWDDWGSNWPDQTGASSDYDLYLYRGPLWDSGLGKPLSSQTTQDGSQPPAECVVYNISRLGTYYLRVYSHNASGDHHLEIYSFDHDLRPNVPGGSLMIPSDAAGAVAVGAVNFANWGNGPQESFSSQGPANASGGGPEGEVIKPDLAGPDGVSSVTYDEFYGTSASAPHVAGAAALLLSRDLNLLPDDLRRELEDHSVDMGDPGKDNIYGSGSLRLPPLTGDEIPTTTKGDANSDGVVSSNDAIMTLRIAAGLVTPTEGQEMALDMNDDGRISSNDAMLILRKAAGL